MVLGPTTSSFLRDAWRKSTERAWPDIRNDQLLLGHHASTSSQSNTQDLTAELVSQYRRNNLYIHHCQVFGRKITPDQPIPCTLYKLNCCMPCWQETEIRELPQPDQIMPRLELLNVYGNYFRTPEPREFDAFDNRYEGYFVHKIPIKRYMLVKRNIEREDYSDITVEELMVYMWMNGGKVGDSLVRFAHPVNNGTVIQYHWKRLETDQVTLEILSRAHRLIRTIPRDLRSRSRFELVLNQIMVTLAENNRPAYLKYNQLKSVFEFDKFSFKKANKFMCQWRMENKDSDEWQVTPQNEDFDKLISDVLAKSKSGFRLPDREFERHRQLILKKVYDTIIENGFEPVLNPYQIRKLSGSLGDSTRGICKMFKRICAENSSTVNGIVDNTEIILKGLCTRTWPDNFPSTFLGKQFESVLNIGGTLDEHHLGKIATCVGAPYERMLLAFEDYKTKWERDHADDNVSEPDPSDEESDGTSDRLRPSIFARPHYASPRYHQGSDDIAKLECQAKWEKDLAAYNAQYDKEGDSDIDLIEDSDGAADETREQDAPCKKRRDEVPCSSGQLSVRSARFGSMTSAENKPFETPKTLAFHKAETSKLDEGSPPEESEGGNSSDREPEYDADSESDDDESTQRGKDEEVPMDIAQEYQQEDHPGHYKPEHVVDNESNDDEPGQHGEDEEVPMEIDQQYQEKDPSGNVEPEHDDYRESKNEAEVSFRIQPIAVPIEAEQPRNERNRAEDHEKNGKVPEVLEVTAQIQEIVHVAVEQPQQEEDITDDDQDDLQGNGGHPDTQPIQADDEQKGHEENGRVSEEEPVMLLQADGPVSIEQPPPAENLLDDTQDGLQQNDGVLEEEPVIMIEAADEAPDEPHDQTQRRDIEVEPQLPVRNQENDVPVAIVQPQLNGNLADDDQYGLQGNGGNPDPQPQPLLATIDSPRQTNAGLRLGQIQNAPVVNQSQQTVSSPRPNRGRAGQPIQAIQPRRVSARIQKASCHVQAALAQRPPVRVNPPRRAKIQAVNQLRNHVLPPRAPPRRPAPATARPQRAQGRNVQSRNGGYHSGQILTQAQVNQFLARNTWGIRVVMMSQAEIQAFLGRNRRGSQVPPTQLQFLRRSERIRQRSNL